MIDVVETSAWVVGLIALVAIAVVFVLLNEAERPNRPHRASTPPIERKDRPA